MIKFKVESIKDMKDLKDFLVERHKDRVGYKEEDMDKLVQHISGMTFLEIIGPLTDYWLESGEYETFDAFKKCVVRKIK